MTLHWTVQVPRNTLKWLPALPGCGAYRERVTSQISQSARCPRTMQPLHLSLLLLLSPVLASPLPQQGNPLPPPPLLSLITSQSGLETPEPVILLQPTSFEDVFAGFPDFGQFESFPSFSGFDNIHIPHPPQIELKDIFEVNKEQPLNPVGDCGLICKVDYLHKMLARSNNNKMPEGLQETGGSARPLRG